MTYDEWFAGSGYDECHKEIMKRGWFGAIGYANMDAKDLPKPEDVVVNVKELLQLTPRQGDVWLVRVKGGRTQSQVYIVSINQEFVWVTDPVPNQALHIQTSQHRQHRLEYIEFLKPIHRCQ